MNQALDCCFVYVSNAVDADISIFHLDTQSGQLKLHSRQAAGEAVMPMAVTTDQALLYAATRGGNRKIIAYTINPDTGRLSVHSEAPIGSGLAYLSVDRSGRYLFGASYGEHQVSLYRADRIANADGTPLQVFDGIENAHAVLASPDGRFVYASSLGSDRVFCYELLSDGDGKLVPLGEATLERRFGPRHMRLSPDGNTLYLLSEFRAVVAAFSRNSETGQLATRGVSARPPVLAHLQHGWARPSSTSKVQLDPKTIASLVWAAEFRLTPDGRFAYVSERTSSRLLAYRIEADGSLEYASSVETEQQPRGFSIDPPGRFLVACGEKSSHVACLCHRHALRRALTGLALRRRARRQLGGDHPSQPRIVIGARHRPRAPGTPTWTGGIDYAQGFLRHPLAPIAQMIRDCELACAVSSHWPAGHWVLVPQ
jgi:6-phosphogluconolactonase